MGRPRSFDENTVLETAMIEFWRLGFEAVTFRSLSEKTGLGLRSLSNAFGDKETLFIRALEFYVARVEKNLPALLEKGGVDALVKLFANVSTKHPSESPRQNGCLIVNQLAIAQLHDARLKVVIKRYFDCLTQNFREALIASEIVDELNERVRYLVTLFVGMQLTIRLHHNTRVAADTAAQMAIIVNHWKSIAAQIKS